MKVIVLIKANERSEAGEMPSEQLMTEMGNYNEELVNAGIMLSGEGLHPSSRGKRIKFLGKDRTVTDGPFAETKELIAGFWIWRVKSMDEAIEWVKRCPNPMGEESEIEIRPILEADDFGEALTPEILEHEAGLRAQTLGFNAPRFENRQTMTIAGINQHYTMDTRMNISSQWRQFFPHINSIPNKRNQGTYGVRWREKPDCSFDYLSGVEVFDVNRLPDEYESVTIPASRYVVFTHTEHVSTIIDTIDTLFNKWVPDCELTVSDSPSFIHHTDQFDRLTGMGGVEIWIPLQT